MINEMSGPWLVCASLILIVAVVARSAGVQRSELLICIGLALCALLARLTLGLWGPFHVNGQGPLWIRGAIEGTPLTGYGPGYFEVFNWVVSLIQPPDYALFAANAVLSALSAPLLYASARLFGIERGAALLAACIIAVDPVGMRTAASEGYSTVLIFLLLGVHVALGLSLVADRRRQGAGAALALLAAALLAAQLARVHAMGYLPLALSPLLVAAAAYPQSLQRRLLHGAIAGAAIGSIVLLVSGQSVLNALNAPMASRTMQDLSVPSRHIMVLLVLGALVLLLRRRLSAPFMTLAGIAALLLMLATQRSYDQHVLQRLAYQRLFSPLILLGLAGLVPRVMQQRYWTALAAVPIAVALFVPVWPQLSVSTTEYLEYHFLREVLQRAPQNCHLAAIDQAEKRVWIIPQHLLPGARTGSVRLSGPKELRAATDRADCLLYVHSSLCSSEQGRPLCDAVEADAKLEKIADASFPARASYRGLPFDRSEVPVILYRVTGYGDGQVPPSASRRRSLGAPPAPAAAMAEYERLRSAPQQDGCQFMSFDTIGGGVAIAIRDDVGRRHVIEIRAEAADQTTIETPADAAERCSATVFAIEEAMRRAAGNP